jgi:outer membrane protein assembly factor BamA
MGNNRTTTAITICCAIFVGTLAATEALAVPELNPPREAARTAVNSLTLENMEFQGNSRTSAEVIAGYLGLETGSDLDQGAILAGIERLRASGFFNSVEFYTRPGSRRGAVILVVEVKENGPGVRFGTGNSDLDGWYLIPAELSLDNIGGNGERAALQLRLGYRLIGLYAHYLRGVGPHERTFWGARAHGYSLNQVYAADGIMYAQQLTRGGLDLHVGRKLGGGWSLAAGLRSESVEVDSTGTVWRDDDLAGVSSGDDVAFGDLPAGIAAGVGKYNRIAWRTDLVLDTRSSRIRAGSPESGVWGRLRLEAVNQQVEDQEDDRFGAASIDARFYQKLGAGVFAWGARGAVVGNESRFPDRHYLGGLYTVRGFPSNSLSQPGGDRGIWHSSLEYRAPLMGPANQPRVAGSLFVDAGGNGEHGETVAAGAGWGLRLRLGESWYLGGDVAVPLTDSPAADSFQGHFSLGWKF